MINCIIVDDEEHALEVIRNFCKKIPYLNIIGEFSNPLKAVSFINLHSSEIDLVFLDIEMPHFSGIDFLKAYSFFPNVIMVTAYTDFALDSYQYGVVDYLLKPFSFDRFSMAINKVREKQKKNKAIFKNIQEEERHILYLKMERNKYIKLTYAEIKHIQGAKNYTVIQTATEAIVASERLNELEQLLPPNCFLRTHKSFIINMDHFESLKGNRIQLKGTDDDLPLGATYRQGFLDYINEQMRSTVEKKLAK
ncbi:LytR/AlgR family response regulator transcription factor [Sphingobacterium lumbrici]|uniref:LytR/AlgR family response regulator transcription factor n=1 Tax=Sphingobacterium lumbrici TaxID=2559600 RepID=UPI0011261D75|nr:LytTR family DNA-binding domain-containing protein [Sphingobacterium lumbrici]